jgi:hypothetical protein
MIIITVTATEDKFSNKISQYVQNKNLMTPGQSQFWPQNKFGGSPLHYISCQISKLSLFRGKDF